jgi:hypothetical protein
MRILLIGAVVLFTLVHSTIGRTADFQLEDWLSDVRKADRNIGQIMNLGESCAEDGGGECKDEDTRAKIKALCRETSALNKRIQMRQMRAFTRLGDNSFEIGLTVGAINGFASTFCDKLT